MTIEDAEDCHGFKIKNEPSSSNTWVRLNQNQGVPLPERERPEDYPQPIIIEAATNDHGYKIKNPGSTKWNSRFYTPKNIYLSF